MKTSKTKKHPVTLHEVVDGGFVIECPLCSVPRQVVFGEDNAQAIKGHMQDVHKQNLKFRIIDKTVAVEEVIIDTPEETSAPVSQETPVVADVEGDLLAYVSGINKDLIALQQRTTQYKEDAVIEAKNLNEFFNTMYTLQDTMTAQQIEMSELEQSSTPTSIERKAVVQAEYDAILARVQPIVNHPWYILWKQDKDAKEAEKVRLAQAKALETEKYQAEQKWKLAFSNAVGNEGMFTNMLEGRTWLPVKVGTMKKRDAQMLGRSDAEPFMMAVWFKVRAMVKKDYPDLKEWEIIYHHMCVEPCMEGSEMSYLDSALKTLLDGYIDWAYASPTREEKQVTLSNGEEYTVSHTPFSRQDAVEMVESAIRDILREYESAKGMTFDRAAKKYLRIWDKDNADKAYWLGDRKGSGGEKPHRMSADNTGDGGATLKNAFENAKPLDGKQKDEVVTLEPHPDAQ